jgi:branched-subunit amino acid transport protein
LLCALLAVPTLLVGPALRPGSALLPADLLVHFEPWRSQLAVLPEAYWDPLVWDGIAQYYPWRLFASESLRAGHLPLWNPYQFCGTPFLANGQSAVLYPLNLLFWVLPVAWAFGLSAWLHLGLAGWFAYLFLRRIGAGRAGSLCGGVVWQVNSFFVAWLHLPTVICSAVWLPLILLLGERALTTGRARYALAGGTALALAYLGGHPQIFLFVGMMTVAYVVARGLSAGGAGRGPALLGVGRLLVAGVVMAVTGLGLAAGQLLPTLDLMRIAHRAFTPGPQAYAAFLSRALPVPMLANLVLPHPLGHPGLGTYAGPENYAEYCCYVGIVALALALWGAFTHRSWHARFFALSALAAVLIAAGTPLNWPLYHWLPGMAGAGGPARMVLLAVFSLSILAGLGFDSLGRPALARAKGSLPPAPAIRSWGPALLLLLVGAAAAFAGWFFAGLSPVAEPETAQEVAAEAERGVGFVVAAIVLLFVLRIPSLRRVGQAGLLVILAADLLLAAQHHAHIVPQQWVYSERANPGPMGGRVLGNAADWPINRFPVAVLPPNAATVYHLRDAFGYDSLYLAHYRDFASLIQGGDPSPPLNGNLLLARLGPTRYGLDMISLAGVKTVLSPLFLPGLRLERAGGYDTLGNPYARPRAWIAQSAVAVPSHQEAVAALTRLGGYEDFLVITGADEPPGEIVRGTNPTAQVRDVSPNEVVVELARGGGGYLFLADSCAPGWHAYSASSAGSQPAELSIRVADVTFRAVEPPREAKSVAFRYQPAAFRVGLFLALATLAGLAIAFGFVVTKART